MRLTVLRLVALAVLLLAVGVVFYLRDANATFSTSGLSVGLCEANDSIAPQTRDEVSAIALSFVEVLARSPAEAHRRMSRRGRAATVERAQLENVQAALRTPETVGAAAVTETYVLRFLSGSKTGLQAPCDFRDGRAVFIGRGGTPTSAMVLIAQEISGSSQRTATVWLEREHGEWRVRALHVGISRIAGMDAEQLWQAAREQRSRGHDFNAAMLYAAARSAQQRGSFYQARMAQDFNADMRTLVAPELVNGAAPFTWRFGDDAFHVTHVQYMGFETGDVALVVDHTLATRTDNAGAEAANHRLIDGFIAACPEWREVFAAVIARATRPDGGGTWGTVFRRSDGYIAPEGRDGRDSGAPSPSTSAQ